MNDEKFVMCVLCDKVSGNFGFPVCFENAEVAKRNFVDLVKNNQFLRDHASDFIFYRVGYYDPKTAEIFSKFEQDSDILLTGLEAFALGE